MLIGLILLKRFNGEEKCTGIFFPTKARPSEWSFIAANDGTDVRYVEGPFRSAFYDVSVRRSAQTPTANVQLYADVLHICAAHWQQPQACFHAHG